jgi:hypothetical protein
MIGGEVFLLLKTGSSGPESSKQAETLLAGFAIILAFGSPGPALGVPRRWDREGRENAFGG